MSQNNLLKYIFGVYIDADGVTKRYLVRGCDTPSDL